MTRPIQSVLFFALALLLFDGCAFKGSFGGSFSKDTTGALDVVTGVDTLPGQDTVDTTPDTKNQTEGLLVYLDCIHQKKAKGPHCVDLGAVPAAVPVDRCRRDNCFEWTEDPDHEEFDPAALELCFLNNCLTELSAGGDGSGSTGPCKGFFECAAAITTPADLPQGIFRCFLGLNPSSDDLAKLAPLLPCYFQWRLDLLAGTVDPSAMCPCFSACGYAPLGCN